MAYDLSGFQGKVQATISALPAAPDPKALMLIAKAIEGTTPSVALSDILAASTAQQAIITAQGTAAIGAINDARDDAIEAIQQAGQGSSAASGISVTPTGGIGATNVQSAIAELDAEKQPLATALTALGALAPAADRLPYFTGAGAGALATFTAAARALLDDADAATMLRTLGLTDGSGKLLASLLPALAISDIAEVGSQADMLALTAQVGDIAIRTDLNRTFALAAEPAATLANWKELRTPTDTVLAVAGLTGTITKEQLKTALQIAAADIGDATAAGRGVLTAASYASITALLLGFGGDGGVGGAKGLVPAPAAGDAAAGKFLKADGTWAVPPGSGGGGMTDDDRIAWIEIAKLKATALRLATSAADDFKDSSGVNVPDPAITGLLHLDGNNNSTSTPDDAGGSFSVTGGAKLSTAQAAFGTASVLFSAVGDSVFSAASPRFGVGTGDFTVNARVRLTSIGKTQFIYDASGSSTGHYLYVQANNTLYFGEPAGNGSVVGTTALVANTWYDIEVTRASGVVRIFLNGAVEASGTISRDLGSSQPMRLGADSGVSTFLSGYIDEFRFSKGIARHTAAFTPATAPFSAGEGANITYDAANNLITNIVSGAPAPLDLRSVPFPALAVPTKGSIFFLAKATAGAITANTNLTASISRDGGTTWTVVTLQNLGALPSGYALFEANNVDIGGQPSGQSMKYRIQTTGTTLGLALDAVVFSWG